MTKTMVRPIGNSPENILAEYSPRIDAFQATKILPSRRYRIPSKLKEGKGNRVAYTFFVAWN